MDSAAEGGNEDDFKICLHQILNRMITERFQQPSISNKLLILVVLEGKVTKKDDDLTTQVPSLSRFLEILLHILKNEQECIEEVHVLLEEFLNNPGNTWPK